MSDTSKPFLSVIIPTYNRAHTLPRTLTSVLTQKFQDYEIVVVDDGSKDNTQEVLSAYAKKVQHFKNVLHPRNQGVFAARQSGVNAAKGGWLSFLDSDDEYLKDGLENIAKAAAKYNQTADVLEFQLTALKSNNQTEELGFFPPKYGWQSFTPSYEDVVLKRYLRKDMHRVIKKDVINRHPYPTNDPGFDTGFMADLAKDNYRFLYINETVVLVHLNEEDRLSARQPRNISQAIAAKERFIQNHYQVLKANHRLGQEYFSLAMLQRHGQPLHSLGNLSRSLWNALF